MQRLLVRVLFTLIGAVAVVAGEAPANPPAAGPTTAPAAPATRPSTEPAASPGPAINTLCPVRPDQPVRAGCYTIYEGKKIGFCCVRCRFAFNQNPEKYLDCLPK